MAKKQGWEKGEGSYSSSKGMGITQYRGELAEAPNFSDSKDISKTVDAMGDNDPVSWTQTGRNSKNS